MSNAGKLESVLIPDSGVQLGGDLRRLPDARGLIIFAHGSGSSRVSARNRDVAEAMGEAGFATLLVDLLSRDEEAIDQFTREFRFDIPLLARRVVAATDWALEQATLRHLPVGYFGASTGAAAALIAAAERPGVSAVVSRGGRPDLAGDALPLVKAPTLLIVGGDDAPVIESNEAARLHMQTEVRLEVIEGATHLFEEPGALEKVARLAAEWFHQHLDRTRFSAGWTLAGAEDT